MEDKGSTKTEVTKESERKPSLQHSVSKDDEKMKVKDSISDRTTLAVAEFKQDVIKVNDSQIKSVKAEEINKIAPMMDNEGHKDGIETDQKTRNDDDKSTANEDFVQNSVREFHTNNDKHIPNTQAEEKDEHVSSTDKKDQHKKPNYEESKKQRTKLNQTKTEENDLKEGKLTKEVKAEEKHEIAQIAEVSHNDKDDIDEQCKVSETKLKQTTEDHAPEKYMEISKHNKTIKVPDETQADIDIDLKLDTNTTREEKQTVEGDSVIVSKQTDTISTKVDSKMESPINEKTEIDSKQNDKNKKECSSQERKIKMVKKKKKKSSIVEEPSEICFDELLSPKDVETGKESLANTENSFIVVEPDSEDKMQLNEHPDKESVEISADKSEKTSENLSPIPANGSKTSENQKNDVTLKQIPKFDESVSSNFELEELKPKSAKVNKEFNEVYIGSVGMILMKLTKHVEADIKMVLILRRLKLFYIY